MTAPLDLDAVAHRALEVAKFAGDPDRMTEIESLLDEVERLRAEVAELADLHEAAVNLLKAERGEDYDPAPIIIEYDRMAAERDAYRAVVDAARALAAEIATGELVLAGPVSDVIRLERQLVSAVDALPPEGPGNGPQIAVEATGGRCSQCGQEWHERACGPTHALVAHERMQAERGHG